MERSPFWMQTQQKIGSDAEQCLKELGSIWKEIGYDDQNQSYRLKVVERHVKELFDSFVSEEKESREKFITKIEVHLKNIDELSKELKIEIPTNDMESLPLFELERALRNAFEEYNKVKEDRKNIYAALQLQEKDLCGVLGIAPRPPLVNPVPTEEQLQHFSAYLTSKQDEKSQLERCFQQARTHIIQLMKELEIKPLLGFEKLVVSGYKDFQYTEQNMAALQALQQRLECKLEETKTHTAQLKDKLNKLWDRLNEDEHHRTIFLTENQGFSETTLNAIKSEIARCEQLKRQNIKEFVFRLRDELQSWWDKCLYGTEQRQLFKAFYSDLYTEDLLDLHELELSRLKAFYDNNEQIFKLTQQRMNLWENLLELESRAKDPGRYLNRGGQLLREEKERRMIQKKLPQIEQKLQKMIVDYEEVTGQPFLVRGEPLADIFKKQSDGRKENKEMEKMARKERDRTEIETKLGTATKRKLPRGNTPTPHVSKHPRTVRSDKKQHSTQHTNTSRRSKGRMDSVRIKKVARKIFNHTRSKTPALQERNQADESNLTSYTDFQDHLEQLNVAQTCRSSVVPNSVLRERNTPAKSPVYGTLKSTPVSTPAKPPRKNFTGIPLPSGARAPMSTPRTRPQPLTHRGAVTAPRLTRSRGTLPIII